MHQCVPAKLFEYVRFDSWLLVLAEPRSATAQLFRGTTADVVAPNDVDGMADVIERRYLEFVSRPNVPRRSAAMDVSTAVARRGSCRITSPESSRDEPRAQASRGGGDRRKRRDTADALRSSLAGIGARVPQHRSERRNGRWRLEPSPSSTRVRAPSRHDRPDARRRSARVHLRSADARETEGGDHVRRRVRRRARRRPARARAARDARDDLRRAGPVWAASHGGTRSRAPDKRDFRSSFAITRSSSSPERATAS